MCTAVNFRICIGNAKGPGRVRDVRNGIKRSLHLDTTREIFSSGLNIIQCPPFKVFGSRRYQLCSNPSSNLWVTEGWFAARVVDAISENVARE